MNKIIFNPAFIFLWAVFFFTACSTSDKYLKEVKQLESVLVIIDSSQINYKSVDTAKIRQYTAALNSNIAFVTEYNKHDTLTREQSQLVSEYSSSLRSFEVIIKQYKEVGQELLESKEQIENLIHDLKIAKIEDAKVPVYVQDELIAEARAVRTAGIIVNSSKLNSEKFEKNNPKVSELIELLKKKSNSNKH